MGYTRYWNRTNKAIDKDFVVKVSEIIADCDQKGINIRNGWGKGNPIVTLKVISLNGSDEHDLGHETLYFGNDEDDIGFNFCKTARKPYDYAVREILKYAEENGFITELSDDGPNNSIISDEDWIAGKWGDNY